jgi:hypothetical protein
MTCPVTTRGAGTGNYGQAMPMRGGCVMHMKNMNAVKEIGPGRVICRARDLAQGPRRRDPRPFRPGAPHDSLHLGHRHDRRFHRRRLGRHRDPAPGAALRDLGNIIRLRVVTMEEEPRVLEFRARNWPASPTPMAPTASSPRSRCRWRPPMTGSRCSSPSTISWSAAHLRRGCGQRGRHPDQARHRLSRRPSARLFPAREAPHVEADHTLSA